MDAVAHREGPTAVVLQVAEGQRHRNIGHQRLTGGRHHGVAGRVVLKGVERHDGLAPGLQVGIGVRVGVGVGVGVRVAVCVGVRVAVCIRVAFGDTNTVGGSTAPIVGAVEGSVPVVVSPICAVAGLPALRVQAREEKGQHVTSKVDCSRREAIGRPPLQTGDKEQAWRVRTVSRPQPRKGVGPVVAKEARGAPELAEGLHRAASMKHPVLRYFG